jgi:endonuclease YncB( thermonuclease family)
MRFDMRVEMVACHDGLKMAGAGLIGPGRVYTAANLENPLRRLILLWFLFCLAVQPTAMARGGKAPETVASGRVASVVDGDTVRLESGAQIRLTGIQAPKLPLGRRGFRPWPLSKEAKAAVESLTLGQKLSLRYDGRRIDRHGRLLAQLYDGQGRWIQGEIISRGLARVYSFQDNRSRIVELLALERLARAARRGIWGLRFYRVLKSTETSGFIDTFQIVEGRVASAAVVRGRGYLNFGKDWRTDFTISISPRSRRLFKRAGVAVKSYAGRRLRVRGWLKSFNGPMIEATHPEQIELLEE